MGDNRVVLVNDRSLMSNFRGNYVFGFLSCGPYEKIPRFLYNIFCPVVPANPNTGEAIMAECGVRRVEASLLRDGYKREEVFVAHPEYIEKAITPETKIVGVGTMDPLGIGPVTSALKSGNSIAYNAYLFAELIYKINKIRDEKGYKFKLVLGGSGAWQFKKYKDKKSEYRIDHVVEGEVDSKAPQIFKAIEDGSAPEFIRAYTRTIEEIPEIVGATVNSLIEAMRGCGRGCPFCDVNKRMKRDFPIDRLTREALVNKKVGFDYLWLHSDEMLLYACDNSDYIPNRDAIKELFFAMKALNFRTIGTTHFTLSSVVADPKVIEYMAEANNLSPSKWLGVQPGVETASPKIGKYWLAYKTKPFSVEEWPWVVKEGIKILNQNYIYPCCTLIILPNHDIKGPFPKEEDDDTKETIQLVEDIAKNELSCLMAPLLYVDYDEPSRNVTFKNISKLQLELYYKCWLYNLRQFDKRLRDVIKPKTFSPLAKLITVSIGKLGVRAILSYLKGLVKQRFGDIPENFSKSLPK
ncbi:MAG: radical SAM protein [Nitrososphaerales archaeon]